MKKATGAVVAAALVLGGGALAIPVAVGGLGVLAVITATPQSGCSAEGPSAGSVDEAAVAGLGAVGAYAGEQLVNASIIIRVGEERGAPVRAQAIAVMTAMGESGMRNLSYGDDIHGVRNPDGTLTSSIGMFQEQKWYGSVESRMNPWESSSRYYDRLLAVPGWESLEPTIAAHKAQRNADPFHYQRYWDDALLVMQSLTGLEKIPGLTDTAPSAACAGPVAGDVVATSDGWSNPAVGRKASGFGPRNTGIPGASTYHLGQDIANTCGTSLHAAAAGTVVSAGLTPWGVGNMVKIDHGNGVTTLYGHVLSGTFLVKVGDTVTAGQQIASMGGDRARDPQGAGTSSGCHLHFEVAIDGKELDPEPFMAERGIQLGSASAASA